MQIESEFIAGAANTVAKGTVWLEMEDDKSVLLYGIANVIGVVDIDSQNVLCTLPAHLDRVTTLTKLNDFSTRQSTDLSTPITVVSSSADGSVLVWEHSIGSPITSWKIVARLQIPESRGSITTHTALTSLLGTLISASNSHGTLVTWFRPSISIYPKSEEGGFVYLETLQMQAMHMPNDLMLMALPSAGAVFSLHQGNHPVLLAIGSVDSKVHLRVLSLVQKDSSPAGTTTTTSTKVDTCACTYASASSLVGVLTGHDDWIRCLSEAAYVTDRDTNITSLYFASGSQDSKIRVWRITPAVTLMDASSVSLSTQELSVSEQEQEPDDDEEDDQGSAGEDALSAKGRSGGGEGGVVDGISDEGLGEARCAFKCLSRLQTSPSSYTESASRYLVTLDALLVGHEDWVSSVHWVDSGVQRRTDTPTPTPTPTASNTNWSAESFHTPASGTHLKLFSTSMDRNMVIWCPDEDSGIWLPTTRMGDIGGNLGGSVGGNLLGFVGSCIDLRSHSVLGIGYGGSFHLWQWRPESDRKDSVSIGVENIQLQLQSKEDCQKDDDEEEEEEEDNQGVVSSSSFSTEEHYTWRPVPFLTGHFAEVRDIVWGYTKPSSSASSPSSGPFLISVSADQTCRLFSPLTTNSPTSTSNTRKWCELSRPQIHGYDLSCIQLAPLHAAPFTIYSGGDEKAVRIFESPLVVAEGLVQLSGNGVAQDYCHEKNTTVDDGEGNMVTSPSDKVYRAYIPELGLSNKPADLMSEEEVNEQVSRGVDTSLWVTGPPLEGQLSDYTIWPEVKKLFGHVGDVVCLSASPCGRWIASAGKGRDAASACIRLWETRRMVCVAMLSGHESTATALRFSPDSRYLISGGKDRSLYLYQSNPSYDHAEDNSAVPPFVPCAYLSKAHKRIIWDIAWITVADGVGVFASVSRDGSLKIWNILTPAVQEDEGGGGRVGKMCTLQSLVSVSPFVNTAAVTALDVTAGVLPASGSQGAGWLLAVGAENGLIQLWHLSQETLLNAVAEAKDGKSLVMEGALQHKYSVLPEYCHGAAVRRLRWCRDCNSDSCVEGTDTMTSIWKLASCGDDHCVRVWTVFP